MPKFEFCLIGGNTETVMPCDKHPPETRCNLKLKTLIDEGETVDEAYALVVPQVPEGARIWSWWQVLDPSATTSE